MNTNPTRTDERRFDPNRQVHASDHEFEVVRYDRTSKWYLEPRPDGRSAGEARRKLTLAEAVGYAVNYCQGRSGQVNLDLPGGSTFDRKYREATGG